jgi:O-antigen/teichoic acid export membrane protein
MLRLAITALPLGITVMLTALNSNIPRYFLSEHNLGIFAGLASLTILGTTVITALGRASVVRFARYFTERNSRAFKVLLLRLLGFAALLVAAGILLVLLAGRQIVELLFTKEFAEHTLLLLLLVACALFEYFAALLGAAVTATREFKRLAAYYVLVTVFTLLLAFLLIPRLGLFGAAWTLMGTYSSICLVLLFILLTAWRRARGTSS